MTAQKVDEKLLHSLQDMYDAEHQFLNAQEEMLKHATNGTLQKLLRTHITQTQGQIVNLEQVFDLLGEKAKRKRCDGAAGLIQEAEKEIKEAADDPAERDITISWAATKAEHYEIVGYRHMVAEAGNQGKADVLRLLEANLRQEEETAQLMEDEGKQLMRRGAKASHS